MDPGLIIGAVVTFVLVTVLAVWREPVLAFAQRAALFTQQVRAEVRKVTWPSWDELRRSTIVIIILVIILGLIIGLMDVLFSKLLIDFLGRAIG